MSPRPKSTDAKEENLVQLYQDIMQCEEDHAKSVLILLSESMIKPHPHLLLPQTTGGIGS